MGAVSTFFNTRNLNQLGASDRAWAIKKADYFNAANPPQVPLSESAIRAREGLFLQARADISEYVRSNYSISYLKSIPQVAVSDLAGYRDIGTWVEYQGYQGGDTDESYYRKAQDELARALTLFLYSQLNSIDQSLWYELLLRIDRGGITDDAFIKHDYIVGAAVVGAAAIAGTIAVGAYATLAGAGAAAATSELAAASATNSVALSTQGGTLLGSQGLLTGASATVAETTLTLGGTAATTSTSAGFLSSLGTAASAVGSSALGALEASGGALIANEAKKFVSGLQGSKENSRSEVLSQPNTQKQNENLLLIAAAAVAAYLFI